MFQIGDMVEGWVYNERGDEVKIVGAFVARTDDPEEFIQDIIVRTPEGKTVYIDEQVARLHKSVCGNLDGDIPNHFDHTSRNFQPK